MPKTSVVIESNLEDGIKTAEKLTNTIPRNADEAALLIADSWRREAQRTMQKNGSVVTGTGIRSMRLQDMGDGAHAVFGADYLLDLETGTQPHWPDSNNYRFIAAARSYGMGRQELAESIAKKGTKPHPWMASSTAKIRRSAPKRVKIKMNDAMQESLSSF